jgi:hypothetical protein
MSARDAFPGYDDPVNIQGDPEEAIRALIEDEVTDEDADKIEPVLDE